MYKEATGLLEGYYQAFYDETRLAGKGRAEAEEEAGIAALEKDLLQEKIARPLSEQAPLCKAISSALQSTEERRLPQHAALPGSLAVHVREQWGTAQALPYQAFISVRVFSHALSGGAQLQWGNACNVHERGVEGCGAVRAGELQTSLQREKVLWTKGLLVTPAIVYDLLDTIMVRSKPRNLLKLCIMQSVVSQNSDAGVCWR